MTTPKSRPIDDGGTTAGSREAPENRADKPDGAGKQTIESSRREARLGQRPTRDDGDNDDQGELK